MDTCLDGTGPLPARRYSCKSDPHTSRQEEKPT